ncbi:MAG TPA: DNA polymerase III subunit beta [Candidatus Paceibacterota bacterium]|nr:DNA polymerase III subunit beta [Candidatus Paceibacterota bacterium]HOK97332.1 DNA polymerase III subunit beta [Candidatus Paceibacterota bacterium]HPP64774.1 DNA polymerase III subunit beta [Candidatus Paceibacterota bacterium]
MKFITLVENLKKAVVLAERITSKNITLPILSNVLIETNKNQIHLKATDLEIGAEINVSGKTEKEGKVVIPAKTFSDFLNSLPEEKIILEAKENNLKVESGKFKTIFQGYSSEDFPIIPQIKTDKFIEIEKGLLKEGLEQVILSVGYSTNFPELTSVLFKIEQEGLKLVGTDRYRLAVKTIPSEKIKTNLKEDFEALVPLRTIQEVLKMLAEKLEDESEIITISPDPNQIQFATENVRLISRLINAEYPNFKDAIPTNFENQVILKRTDLKEAIKVIGIFSGKVNEVKFRFNPSKKEVVLEAQDPTLGQSETLLDSVEIKGNPLDIAFNYRFFLDGLEASRGEEVFIGLNKENSPVLMRGKEESNFLYVLVPSITV